jgi:hypothetical protein
MEKLNIKVTSFNLPKFIDFPNKDLLNEDIFKTIYDLIFSQRLNNISINFKGINNEPIFILGNKMIIFPSAFAKTFNTWNSEMFTKNI